MKRMIQLALLAAAGFMSVNSVPAQIVASATIPFDFTVQHKTMPSGQYLVESLEHGTILLTSPDGKFHEISLVNSAEKVGKGSKLVFHRYGDQYFLNEIQIGWNDYSMQLPVTKAEKQAQVNEATLPNDATAIVAMK